MTDELSTENTYQYHMKLKRKNSFNKGVFLIDHFNPIIGGVERQSEILAAALIKKGINITVVTGWWNRSLPKDEIISGIHVHRCFIPWIMIKGTKRGGSFFSMVSFFLYLIKNRKSYDFIQCFQVLNESFVALLVKRLINKAVIARNGSSGITCDSRMIENYFVGKFKRRFIINNLKCLIGISKDSTKGFIEKGYNSSKIYYISNGVVIPHHKKESYLWKNKIVYIGRLSYEKGVDVLIEAIHIVVTKYSDVKLDIIGDGPAANNYKMLIKRLAIEQNVNFLGIRYDLENYYLNSDIFILPSRTEGMSNVLLEAMSYGLPCIVTTVGGAKELIKHGENGYLVKPNDLFDLATNINELIKLEEIRKKIGINACKTVEENYSIEKIGDKYIDLYNKLGFFN